MYGNGRHELRHAAWRGSVRRSAPIRRPCAKTDDEGMPAERLAKSPGVITRVEGPAEGVVAKVVHARLCRKRTRPAETSFEDVAKRGHVRTTGFRKGPRGNAGSRRRWRASRGRSRARPERS